PVPAGAVQPGGQPGRRAGVEAPRHPLEAQLLHGGLRGLVAEDRARTLTRDPGVELLLRRRDRGLRAVAGQDPGVRWQGQQVLPDRVELAGEVRELTVLRGG